MRISAAFLADHAEVRDGRLQVRGGVWTALTAPAFPASHPLTVVMLLEPSSDSLRLRKQGALEVVGPDQKVGGRTSFELELSVMAVQIPLVATVSGEFRGPGRHEVVVTLNGQEQTRVAFDVSGPRPVVGGPTDWSTRVRLPG